MGATDPRHWLVIPLFGTSVSSQLERIADYRRAGLGVVLVDNNPKALPDDVSAVTPSASAGLITVAQRNLGGLAGGFNAGIRAALGAGAEWITLLDQDSDLDAAAVAMLQQAWGHAKGSRLLVGPSIHEAASGGRHGKVRPWEGPYDRTRLLISSGTTFSASDWGQLGPLHEELFIDFLDHAWCFRAARKGFLLLQDRRVKLHQRFGEPHPDPLCRRLGMQLYSPMRHYYGLRNLRWLCLQPEVPLDLKLKEILKMMVKPWLWLLCESRRWANAVAILRALTDPLPGPHP